MKSFREFFMGLAKPAKPPRYRAASQGAVKPAAPFLGHIAPGLVKKKSGIISS